MHEDTNQCQKWAVDPTAQFMSFFKQYVDAKNEYDDACRCVRSAQERRSKSEQHLAELNNRLLDVAQRAMNDPTMPEPCSPNVPAYGYRSF